MDLSGVLLPTDRDMGLSASPPGGGWPEAAWTHSYLPEPTSSADRQQAGGSPSGSCHRQPQHYSDYTDMGGGSGGWGSQGADPARPSAARRVLCRSQSEAGGSSARMSVDSPPAADIAAAATTFGSNGINGRGGVVSSIFIGILLLSSWLSSSSLLLSPSRLKECSAKWANL